MDKTTFIEQLLDAKGITEGRGVARAALAEQLDEQVERDAIQALPAEQLLEFEHLMDTENVTEETLQELFKKGNVDLVAVMKNTLTNFQKAYLKEDA